MRRRAAVTAIIAVGVTITTGCSGFNLRAEPVQSAVPTVTYADPGQRAREAENAAFVAGQTATAVYAQATRTAWEAEQSRLATQAALDNARALATSNALQVAHLEQQSTRAAVDHRRAAIDATQAAITAGDMANQATQAAYERQTAKTVGDIWRAVGLAAGGVIVFALVVVVSLANAWARVKIATGARADLLRLVGSRPVQFNPQTNGWELLPLAEPVLQIEAPKPATPTRPPLVINHRGRAPDPAQRERENARQRADDWRRAAQAFLLWGQANTGDGRVSYSLRRMQTASGITRAHWQALKTILLDAGVLMKRGKSYQLAENLTLDAAMRHPRLLTISPPPHAEIPDLPPPPHAQHVTTHTTQRDATHVHDVAQWPASVFDPSVTGLAAPFSESDE